MKSATFLSVLGLAFTAKAGNPVQHPFDCAGLMAKEQADPCFNVTAAAVDLYNAGVTAQDVVDQCTNDAAANSTFTHILVTLEKEGCPDPSPCAKCMHKCNESGLDPVAQLICVNYCTTHDCVCGPIKVEQDPHPFDCAGLIAKANDEPCFNTTGAVTDLVNSGVTAQDVIDSCSSITTSLAPQCADEAQCRRCRAICGAVAFIPFAAFICLGVCAAGDCRGCPPVF